MSSSSAPFSEQLRRLSTIKTPHKWTRRQEELLQRAEDFGGKAGTSAAWIINGFKLAAEVTLTTLAAQATYQASTTPIKVFFAAATIYSVKRTFGALRSVYNKLKDGPANG